MNSRSNVRVAKELVRIARELISEDKHYIARSEKVKEGQKNIILKYIKGLPDTDKEGAMILGRWLLGLGDWENAPFGDYLMKNESIRRKLVEKLDQIIEEELNAGSFEHIKPQIEPFHMETDENGYNTGYEYLHGTDKTVGDFQMEVDLQRIPRKGNNKPETIQISVKCVWNDKIDANRSYNGEGETADYIQKNGILPDNYVIRIPFEFKSFWIRRDREMSWEKKGYPWEKI